MTSLDRPSPKPPQGAPASAGKPPEPSSRKPRRITWLRRLLLCIAALFGVVVLAAAAIVGRLAWGPVDVTWLTKRWQPITFADQADGRIPLGALDWTRLLVEWNYHRPLEVTARVEGLTLGQPDMPPLDTLESAQATIGWPALFHRRLALYDLQLGALLITLRQEGTGQFDFLPAGLFQGGESDKDGHDGHAKRSLGLPAFLDLSGLRGLGLKGLSLRVVEADGTYPVSGMTLTAPDFALRYVPGDGWTGSASATLKSGGKTLTVAVGLKPEGHDRTSWVLKVSPFVPSDIAFKVPGPTAALVPWHVPVTFSATGALARSSAFGFARPLDMHLHLLLGKGELTQPSLPPERFLSGDGEVDLVWAKTAPWRTVTITAPRLHLLLEDAKDRPVPVDAVASAHLDDLLAPQKIDAKLSAKINEFDFATLGSIWPEGLVRGGRRWMTKNMTAGQGVGLEIHTSAASTQGFGGLDVTQLGGHLVGHDLTVWWLRPVQPVTGIEAQAHFADMNTLDVTLQDGKLADGLGGVIRVTKGDIVLSKLMGKTQYGDIKLDLSGKFGSVLHVLSYPRLRLLSRHPLPLSRPIGTVKGVLDVFLPLNSWVTMNDIDFNSTVDLFKAGADVKGVGPVRDTTGRLHVTSDALTFKGATRVKSLPLTLSSWSSFNAPVPGKPLNRVSGRATLTPQDLKNLGVALPPGLFAGKAYAEARLVQIAGPSKGKGQVDVTAKFDLTPAAIATVLWNKRAGQPADMTGHAHWTAGWLTALDHVQAHGPALSLSGRTLIRAGQIGGIRFERFQVGRSEGNMTAEWPVRTARNLPYVIALQATALDVTPFFAAKGGKKIKKTTPAVGKSGASILPEGAWRLAVDAGKIYYSEKDSFSGVSARANWSAKHLQMARLDVAGPYKLHAAIAPEPGRQGTQTLDARASDLGALFATLGLTERFAGGRLDVNGQFAPSPQGGGLGAGLGLAPFTGRLDVHDFALVNPPGLLKTLAHLSFTHSDLLRGNRFGGLEMKVDVDGRERILSLKNGLVANALIGGTTVGTIDLATRKLALKGTISPFYALNSAPGRIPDIGWIFAPQKNSGVLAALYCVTGTLADPKVSIDPFTILLPGVLRLLVP